VDLPSKLSPIATFSIAAADPEAHECGVAVASKFLAVGVMVPWARAGVGAVATQSWANLSYGPDGLQLLAEGVAPAEVIKRLTDADAMASHRQVGVVDMQGRSATFTGEQCGPWAGGRTAPRVAVQGNILVSDETVASMLAVFQGTPGRLATRLLAALSAGDQAGGDSRGRQSAALLVVKPGAGYGGFNDRYLDLRVDDHPDPVVELGRIFVLWQLYFEKALASELMPIDSALAAELRRGLRQLGYDPGPDGEWDDRAQAVFAAFAGRENLEERLRIDGQTDRRVIEYFRARVSAPLPSSSPQGRRAP
jgi:uncharacterized Ntn-hydrolase superfamily protein